MAIMDATAADKNEKKKKHKTKEKRKHEEAEEEDALDDFSETKKAKKSSKKKKRTSTENPCLPPHKYILAPMVGASELPFRLLCRRYGTQLAYTPMMSSSKFAHDKVYRRDEFQTCPQDRPLVCHFAANDPDEFAAAVRKAQPYCDAIDLNLGCPQRTAFLGHFGSYLLDEKDRDLICSIVQAGASVVPKIPIFCKIRLLDTLEETIQLCRRLRDAGASLIAIHARYRASWDRKGPGARDGPALLEQVTDIKKALDSDGGRCIPIITNGNTTTYQDVRDNLQSTGADGIMSAEGILDNPALFLPQLGSPDKAKANAAAQSTTAETDKNEKKKSKLIKKLHKIARLEQKVLNQDADCLDEEDQRRLGRKEELLESLREMISNEASAGNTSLEELYQRAENKVTLAHEYLDLATAYPDTVKMRTVIFHIRRMIKHFLEQYQLMEECLACKSISNIRSVLEKIAKYQERPESFVFDTEKAKEEKEALERKRREEGKRKAYEARMMRKAKREGKKDLLHYLHIGAELPTAKTVSKLKAMARPEALEIWKQHHSQHCLAFHLDTGGCVRGRACAFLHVDLMNSNAFDEKDEVAG